jgi:hypothetical protein
VHDLNTILSNLAVSFKARAESADREAAAMEAENARQMAAGVPAMGLPSPAEKRAVAAWLRKLQAACADGVVLMLEGPAGAPPLNSIPGVQEAMSQAFPQGRVRYEWQTAQPSGTEGARNTPAHL